MNWLSWIPGIFKGTKGVVEVFKENAENKGLREHVERMTDAEHDMSVLKQFSTEFHQRENRSFWDSFVDGLNRLPRPLITFAILSFFIIAPLYPEEFLQIAKAYELMPNGYWALLSIIIGFYFGGRMQLKNHDMTVKGNAVQAAKDLISMRREFREFNQEEDSAQDVQYRTVVNSGAQPLENKVIKEWLKTRAEQE